MGCVFGKWGDPPDPNAHWGKPNPVATFETTMGTIKAEIYMDRVPRTASNFIDLCQTGFYDGVHFRELMNPAATHQQTAQWPDCTSAPSSPLNMRPCPRSRNPGLHEPVWLSLRQGPEGA